MVPLLANKHYDRPSVFDPASLLREARRQKSLPTGDVPRICVLDPDGDLFRHLRDSGMGTLNPYWACYHTELYDLCADDMRIGVLGCAVGASFAVLVAEELFASGCGLLISITSAGQITPIRKPPYFVLIDRTLRDEGTSYHYLPPAPYSHIQPGLIAMLEGAFTNGPTVERGGAWTTDAPFRETEEAIAWSRAENLLAVEMEAAALYAFGEARAKHVICFAHVTNQMGMIENDFEKGEADGNAAMFQIILAVGRRWRAANNGTTRDKQR
jgi:uridine phosphorylase